MKNKQLKVLISALVFAVVCFQPLFGAERAPINVNLIIDASEYLTEVKGDIAVWINIRLDQILANGDKVTIWSAGSESKVIYTGTMNAQTDRDAAKRSIQELSGAGRSANFSGALREAANSQSLPYTYTMLISTSTASLSSLLSGSQLNLMRFSRVEEFSGWRAIVVGLNIDTRVRRAAAAFFQ